MLLAREALSGVKTRLPRSPQNVICDEEPKFRAGRWGCLPFITASGLSASTLPQNLGGGQKVERHLTILGAHEQPQKARKDDS
jgi:hypothetical protein